MAELWERYFVQLFLKKEGKPVDTSYQRPVQSLSKSEHKKVQSRAKKIAHFDYNRREPEVKRVYLRY